MSSIHFESTFDNSKLIKGINQANITVGQWIKNTETASLGIERTFNRMATAATAYLSLDFAGRIGREIVNVRGEFQQLGIAFEVMLGSKEKADKLMQQQIAFSQKTPFTLTDVATNTKQLMAMGIGYEKVMGTMKALGDVAAGVSVPISRVATNYGQVATLGKLQTRELRDFAMAGIPLMDELAKNMGKSKAEISDMIEAGRVGFPEVEKAFQTMSAEGGKFYNLMERQNASVTGQISNLTDKIQVMLNEIGKSNEGLIYGSISGLTTLVENYQDVLDVLKVLVVTYGTYKAALIAISAAQGISLLATQAKEWYTMGRALGFATANQIAFNTASKANVYVMAIAGIMGLVTALSLFADKADEAAEAQEKINKTVNAEKAKIEALIIQIKGENTANADRKKALKELNDILPDNIAFLDAQALSTRKGKDAIDEYINSIRKKAEMEKLITDLQKNLDEQDRVSSGGMPSGMNAAEKAAYWSLTPQEREADQARAIYDLKEQEDQIRKNIETTLSGNKSNLEDKDKLKTVLQQIDALNKSITDSEAKLKEWRKPDSTKTAEDIDGLEKSIKADKEKLETLTGIKKKETDKQLKIEEDKLNAQGDLAKKELELIQSLEQAKTNAIVEGVEKQKSIAETSYKEELLKIERDKKDYLETLNKSKGYKITDKEYISSLPQDVQENFDQRSTLAVQKYNNDIVEINKTAADQVKAIWQSATETFLSDLDNEKYAINKKYDDWIKAAQQQNLHQSDIDNLNVQRKKELSEAEIKYALNKLKVEQEIENTNADIETKGLDRNRKLEDRKYQIIIKYAKARIELLKQSNKEESKEEIKTLEQAITLANEGLSHRMQIQEDILNFSRQFTSELVQQLGLTEKESKQLEGIADVLFNIISGNPLAAVFSGASLFINAIISKEKEDPTTKALEHVNELLERQSALLSNLAGTNYFQLAAKQYDDLGKSIDLNNKKLQQSNIHTKEEFEQAQNFYNRQRKDFPNGPISQIPFDQYLKGLKSVTDAWNPQDFIDAYTAGTIVLNNEQLDWIKGILDNQKQRAELLQETFREALGFDSNDVTDSIFQGIENGLKLGENSLGGFAQSFGDLMKKALMQSITDAMNSDITNTFLPKYKEYMSDGSLTDTERKDLESIYSSLIQKGQIDTQNINSIIAPYSKSTVSSSTGVTGSVQGATEETVGALVGQTMAMRVDMKSMVEIQSKQLDVMNIGIGHLSRIEKNTNELYRLEKLERGIEETNRILKEKL